MRYPILKTNILWIPVMLALFLLSGQISHAQPGPGFGRGPWGAGPVMQAFELDLSDKQIEDLLELRSELLQEQLPVLRQRWEKIDELRDLRQSGNQDRTRIESLQAEISELDAKLERAHADAAEKALKVLDEEQRQALGNRPIPLFDAPGPRGGPDGPPGGGRGMHGKRGPHHGRGYGSRWDAQPGPQPDCPRPDRPQRRHRSW